MAITINTILARDSLAVFEVIASADADTTAAINHGFPEAPIFVTLVPILGAAAPTAAQLSLWWVSSITATQININKATTAGSGNAAVQIRVLASRNLAFNAGRTALAATDPNAAAP